MLGPAAGSSQAMQAACFACSPLKAADRMSSVLPGLLALWVHNRTTSDPWSTNGGWKRGCARSAYPARTAMLKAIQVRRETLLRIRAAYVEDGRPQRGTTEVIWWERSGPVTVAPLAPRACRASVGGDRDARASGLHRSSREAVSCHACIRHRWVSIVPIVTNVKTGRAPQNLPTALSGPWPGYSTSSQRTSPRTACRCSNAS
jgi:hypothetical protein